MVLVFAPCGDFAVFKSSAVMVMPLLRDFPATLLAHFVAKLLCRFQIVFAPMSHGTIQIGNRICHKMKMHMVGVLVDSIEYLMPWVYLGQILSGKVGSFFTGDFPSSPTDCTTNVGSAPILFPKQIFHPLELFIDLFGGNVIGFKVSQSAA